MRGERRLFLSNQAQLGGPPGATRLPTTRTPRKGDGVLVHAALPVNAKPSENHDFSIVDLPEVEQTATIVDRDSMDNVMQIIQTPARRKWTPLR